MEQNPTHDYEQAGEYSVTLTVIASAGCSDDTTQVLPVREFFIVTNVLTPNGDDINDYVWITSSLAEVIEAKVYNRWGLSVWEGVGNDLRFSGKTTGGVDLEAGTYYYVVGLNYGEVGVKELTGYITLIRE
ncbi:MAG: gliding motility-associated-like protein [Bacteroidia bacterium]|jgi:gliding motility-associated-like protein